MLSRAYREAQKRIQATAQQRAMLAVRGDFEASRHDLECLKTGDLFSYLAAKDEATNGRYQPPSFLARRLREPSIARYLAARARLRKRSNG
ncbi:hypothetical protein NYR54_00955 [Chelativorans sp. SCAU2101]|uniref:Uncharacterized protein n=1 Tax=Chelativorans petroleitrophicus TaxID=2975484 RepID=A0A9X3B8H6_9HYPH|nr:hypothetical protein [Chelativorans petroleitrophicus]MCT8988866.1 hypothetical protein [Chelativorans petroleitrophicus]